MTETAERACWHCANALEENTADFVHSRCAPGWDAHRDRDEGLIATLRRLCRREDKHHGTHA